MWLVAVTLAVTVIKTVGFLTKFLIKLVTCGWEN